MILVTKAQTLIGLAGGVVAPGGGGGGRVTLRNSWWGCAARFSKS